jgi:hypothetical protein
MLLYKSWNYITFHETYELLLMSQKEKKWIYIARGDNDECRYVIDGEHDVKRDIR